MKSGYVWLIVGAVVLYLYSKNQTAIATRPSDNQVYANDAAGVIEDLF